MFRQHCLSLLSFGQLVIIIVAFGAVGRPAGRGLAKPAEAKGKGRRPHTHTMGRGKKNKGRRAPKLGGAGHEAMSRHVGTNMT